MITETQILFFIVIGLIVFNYTTWKRLNFLERYIDNQNGAIAQIKMVITNNNGFTEVEKQQLNS